MTFTAKSLSDVTTRTGQLKDMLQRLEQSQPLAIRLSGTSTAAQVGGFSYEPNSTWGFDPSASAQRTAHSKNVLSGLSYIEFIYPCFALGTSANELGFPSRHIDKTTVGTSAIQVEWHDAFLESWQTTFANCIRQSLYSCAWEGYTEKVASRHTTVEIKDHPVQSEGSDYLEPTTFNWTESRFKARAAVRQFSESIYGDY